MADSHFVLILNIRKGLVTSGGQSRDQQVLMGDGCKKVARSIPELEPFRGDLACSPRVPREPPVEKGGSRSGRTLQEFGLWPEHMTPSRFLAPIKRWHRVEVELSVALEIRTRKIVHHTRDLKCCVVPTATRTTFTS